MYLKIILLTAICLAVIPASRLAADDRSADGIVVLFSPKDECGRIILDKINAAQKSIDLAIYHFTSRSLSQALVSAVRRGVKVRVFMDGESAKERYSKYDFLHKNGVPVKLESGEGLMHNKFCVIDNALVVSGSYNWTTSADLRNDENILIIDSKDVIRKYRLQFEKYWQGLYKDEAHYLNKYTLEKR